VSVSDLRAKYEVLAEHQSEHGPNVTQVRGSLIASSLVTLRQLDLFDRYIANLPPEYHDQILFVLAASWVPLDAAMAHYKACDEMQLSEHELQEIGSYVSKRIMGTFLGTLMRTATGLIAPGSALRHYPRLWDRLLWGGGCTVSMMAGKDARIESRGVAMFRYRYFRIAYTGLIRGAATVFKESVQARIRNATDNSLTVDISWL
jgi:hypothetical protein